MSQQQRDTINKMMADFPLDLGGDAVEQRAVFEQMMTAWPLADDVTTTSGSLGGVPTLEITTADTRPDIVFVVVPRRLVHDGVTTHRRVVV